MKKDREITRENEIPVSYLQFERPRALRIMQAIAGMLTWPVVLPLALISRLSDFIFVTFSQMLSFIPYVVGVIVRYEFYRFSLKSCGKNVVVDFGTVFLYRDITIGDNVLFGMYNTVHHCDFGSYVLVADGCRFLSGKKYHGYDKADVPIALQPGALRRIKIEENCWIGANAVIMADVASGCIVGAGSVVTLDTQTDSVYAGVPAKLLKARF
jgi:acetyltransferase-like isoleucine patch superfamily enzyme